MLASKISPSRIVTYSQIPVENRDWSNCHGWSATSGGQQIQEQNFVVRSRKTRDSSSPSSAFSLQQVEKRDIAIPCPRTRNFLLTCSLRHHDTHDVDNPFQRTRSAGVGSNCYGRSGGTNSIARRKKLKIIRLPSLSSPNLSSSAISSVRHTKKTFNTVACSALPEMSSVAASGPDLSGEQLESEKMTRKVGAVFFDLDDTLVLTHEADRNAQMAVMDLLKTRAPQLDLPTVLSKFIVQFSNVAWDPEHKVDVTEWRARFWNNAMKSQGMDDMVLAREMQSCFDRERLLGFRWTTGVEKLVRALHEQSVKVGVITNGHPKVQRSKLGACNAKDLFDTILVGGEEPNPKPHRDIFLKACNLAGCKPEESVMVGDTLKTDIQGAISAGFLSTVWVNVHKKRPPNNGVKPHFEISTFAGLQQVLQQLGVSFDPSD